MALIIDRNRQEDYLVKATLTISGTEISGVPCKIYLPERIHEKPFMLLKPLKEDANRIMASWKAAFKATVYGFDKELQTSIESPEVYFSGASTRYWGDDISETTIPGEPQDLHVIRHLKNDECPTETHIVFWISPNSFLTPFMIHTNSYTGDIKCERVRELEFTIKDGQKLVFEKHFGYKNQKNKDLVQWSFLVACTELDIPAVEAETLKNGLMKDIDDFLLIASFAAAQRTACLGWTATDKNSYATFYRGNYTFPEPDDNFNLEDGIIDIQKFQEFMETCYPAFLRYENKLAIRNALNAAVPSKPRSLENSFLSMFSGLETLILDFKRRNCLEFVLSEPVWVDFKMYLKSCIKKSKEPKLERNQRASIYRKLGELNRISLREAFDEFCKVHSIDLADLWPVFGGNGSTGLSDIRNKLIHGDPFLQDLIRTLSIACEHLQYTLQRVILGVLTWDVKMTKVNPAYLRQNLCAIKELPVAQMQLSTFINSQELPKMITSREKM
jgi:hypothetical protein